MRQRIARRSRCGLPLFAAAAAVFAAWPIPATGDTNPAVRPVPLHGKMVCVGASITANEGVRPTEGYVALLKARAAAEHLDLDVVGQGRSGWSTGAYVYEKNRAKIEAAMPADATVITILLGTNDAREAGAPERVAEAAGKNVAELIDMYHHRAPDAQVVVIAPPKIYPKVLSKRLLDAHYGEQSPAILKQVALALAATARKRGLTFIDLSDLPSSPANSIDGVHPNAAGHREIADAIWAGLTHVAGPTTRP